LISIKLTITLLTNFVKIMNAMLSAGKNLERGKLPETSFTAGMTDEEFDRWVEEIGGKPCDKEFWSKMESKGFFRELPPTNSSQAA